MKDLYEWRDSQEAEREPITRRKFLKLSGAFFLLGYITLNDGFRLFSPDTVERLFGSKEVSFRKITYEEIISNCRLVLDRWDFFIEKGEYLQAHRAGNRLEAIDHAVLKMCANYIDIDANYVNGEIFTEHGVIKSLARGMINLVVDPNEGEFRTILPPTFAQSIEHISSLRTDERPLGVNIELKHGYFDKRAFEIISSTLQKYRMPATIQPGLYRAAVIKDIYEQGLAV